MNFSETFDAVAAKFTSWLEVAILLLPNLAGALIVLFVFWFLARMARGLVRNLLGRVSDNRQIVGLLATLAYVGVVAVGGFVALGILNLDKTVTALLAGVGVIGLALGFAFQDLAANFMSGVLMAIRRPFEIDHVIETNGFLGIVEDISLRSTLLRTFQGQIVMLPNKEVFGNAIINYSLRRKRRVDLSCGVAYGDDLEEVRRVALAAVGGLNLRDPDRAVELFFTEFGDSAINFSVRFWIDFAKQTDFLNAQSEAIIALKKAFDEAGITIPFPIRTLDFGMVGGVVGGMVGGEQLAEALPKELFAKK